MRTANKSLRIEKNFKRLDGSAQKQNVDSGAALTSPSVSRDLQMAKFHGVGRTRDVGDNRTVMKTNGRGSTHFPPRMFNSRSASIHR